MPTVYVDKAGRQYREHVWAEVLMARKGNGPGTLRGPLRLEVDAYPPDRRTRDLDNILKALQDSLAAAAVFEDDGQIQTLIVRRQPVRAGGRLRVVIAQEPPRC